jgi:DNA-binding GntR family transcriptional regulator
MKPRLETYKSLKDFILMNHVLPGERLYLQALSAKLNISTTPLREALNRLIQEEFINHNTNGSYTLRAISITEIEQLYDYCEALETYLVRKAAKNVSPSDLSALKENLRTYGDVIEQNYTRDRFLINNQFHLKIAGLGGNEMMVKKLENAFERIVWKWKVENIMEGRGPMAFDEHQAIYAALEQHDEAGAAESMRNHIITTKEHVLKKLSDKEHLFTST